MNYWVISPNAANDEKKYPVKDFITFMKDNSICLIGHNENKRLGKTFKNKVKIGDIVIVSQRIKKIRHNYLAGIVDSDAYLYDYDDSFKPQARRLKNIISLEDKNLSFKKGGSFEGNNRAIHAIYRLKNNNSQDRQLIEEISNYIGYTQNTANTKDEYINLLKENYNLILTGAPGTGKTYLAKQIAAKIIFNDDKKEYTEDLEENDDFKNQCQFVQFHPSYDYTDFVEGLRPVKDNSGNIGFERKDGVFKEFCKKAINAPYETIYRI